MIKMVNKSGTLTKTARIGCHETAKARKVAALLNSLNIGWKIDDDFATIYTVARFREAVSDLSSAAVSELAEMIKGFAQADAD